jgi:hypothetical protein
LSRGADGNFYGTTAANGLNGYGILFRMTPSGDFGAYSFSTLDTNSDNADGANPSAAVTADSAGNLYGTCAAGGTNGSGVIFQVFGPDFIPPYFLSVTNPPPARTNMFVGSSITLSNDAQGLAPLTYQWLRNGTNLTDGGDILGSLTSTLVISPVFFRDVGSYALLISNTWGALTGSVTVLTVRPPGVSISSPAPNARTNSPLFAGSATNAPSTNANPAATQLTNVIFSITNLFNGSNITGLAALTTGAGGASNWSFAVTPFPGSNILSVQSVDVSGNISPIVSRSFFYEVPARLTVLTAGSGAGTFTFTNGAMLNLGQGYSITARPASSVFSSWTSGGITSFESTFPFIMQSNLVLTADFLARQSPAVFISSPTANARTSSSNFAGTAQSSPVLSGVNPNNVRLTNVVYWLSNAAAASVITGMAALTPGATVSNWSFTANPLPGANTLAVQCEDISGGLSPIVSRKFFYKVPALFTLLKAGTGNGTFAATAAAPGDTLPTNGAMLNLGENYTITARPDPFSRFAGWVTGSGSSHAPTLPFTMQPGFALTASFNAVPPAVTISSPVANLRTAAPVFNGTASGHLRLTNVTYSLADSFTGSTSNGSATLTAGAGAVSNWSITVVPSPGTNTLTVQCVDVAGDTSAAVSRTFFYKVPARLELLQAGTGNGILRGSASIPGDILPTNGAMLNLGESYAITATPDRFSLFSNWVSAAGVTDTPLLSFVMQSNLVLTANFVSNFFAAAAGTYNGLFSPADAVAVETSGMLYHSVLRSTGSCSGALLLAGKRYPFTASFDVSGHSAFSAGPLQVDLALDSATPQITGTVSTPQWTADLNAELASNTLPSAEYTILFSPSTNVSADSPPGDGYALVTDQAGLITLSGALADGASYNQTVPVSRTGDLPVYAVLYTNTAHPDPGLLLGWINLTNLQAAAPSNALAWIKKPSPSPTHYTNGFTNILFSQGALWTNPPGKTPAISLSNGLLVISNTDLNLTFTNIAVSNNTLANLSVLPTNSLTGSINPKTGLLTLTFADGNGNATNRAYGVFLQNNTNAAGFFLTPTNAGSFNLLP